MNFIRTSAGSRRALSATRRSPPLASGVAALLLFVSLVIVDAGMHVASAAQQVRAGEVTVPFTDPGSAFPEAMRIALVRLTGRRDADQDPALAPLVADARRYVQIFRPVAGGTQVTFDAGAIERVVAAAGRSIWPRERPVALVVIVQPPAGADAAAVRRSLEETASQRGLPVVLAAAQSAGLGADADAATAMAAARRLGADVALLGQADASDPSGWRWTYFAAGARESYAGGVTAGIHGAADRLAAATQAVMQQPELDALVQVSGVTSLRDYAQVSRLLAATAGVRGVALLEAADGVAVYRVLARGGGDGLAAALSAHSRLRPATDTSGRLAYQFQP